MNSRRWFLRGLAALPLLTAPATVWGRRFKPPGAAARVAAVGPLDDVPEALRPAFMPGPDDLPVPVPGRMDWLGQRAEPGQTFARFKQSRMHVPTEARGKIALLPVGELAASTSLARLVEFAGLFFGMPVAQLEATTMKLLKAKGRSRGEFYQYQTRGILRTLTRRVPDDAYCLIAVTQSDLYPDSRWNFVFGEALLYERVGVYSFARYDPAFYGEAHDEATPRKISLRGFKLLAHEVGHMFGMMHCVHYSCVMNGTNHIDETDRNPLHLCPVCMRKLWDSVGFDVIERERGLLAFYEAQGLDAEAGVTRRRLGRLGG